VIGGTNGTLVIEDVRFVVRKFELDREDDECEDDDDGHRGSGGSIGSHDDDEDDEEECEKFRAPPAFIDLPLGGESALVVRQEVPPGVYKELEFEIRRIDPDLDDGDDEDDRDRLMALLFGRIRDEFPDWPRRASLLVAGSFTPAAGVAREFRAFFDAEIEIELEFRPPLVISEDDERVVTIDVDPRRWFRRPTGIVLDLSQFDFERTRRIVEFEIELKEGFLRTRLDR
jgi:hypothetical protein